MRALPARHLASPAFCAVLLLGIAAPAAVAADGQSVTGQAATGQSESGSSASGQAQVPVPGADALLGQVRSLSTAGGVLTPVTDLLDSTLKADNGQLPADRADELGKAAKDAIKKAAAAPSTVALPAKPAEKPAVTSPSAAGSAHASKPADPAKPAVPGVVAAAPDASADASRRPVTPAAPPLSKTAALAKTRAHGRAATPRDATQDALTALQKAVDALVKASTSGDVGQVVPAISEVVNNLVDVLIATLTGSSLADPALTDPDLAGLIPSTGAADAVTLPSAPDLPPLPSDLILPTS
ncbi:hypothetical protein [Streptomyces griseoaurantiacus]|uniref:hypothetical protein n=1 Tax=Streptomyces griseoaurantiacus TaxID=68213 RepID=UPI002E2896F6|nr:hypothetical protein [Streptomyces jietaisiensis]